MATRPEVNFIDLSLAELETFIAKSLESETSSMTTTPKREIAFIDRGVDDLATLLAGIRPDVEPILLSNDEPAPRQMARTVQGREGRVDAIHVIAHGWPGEVSFGAGVLSVATIAEHSNDLAQLGLTLGDGELQLWTCQTARGERGAAFVDTLARMVGAQVAASTQLVGAAARGGQWALDVGSSYNLAPLSAEGAAVYPGVMTTTSTTINDNNTSATLPPVVTATTNATVNLNNSSGNDSVTTDGSGSTTVNGNNSTGNDVIDIDNATSATVNLNNSTGNDDVDITGTTVNATVNDNNSGVVGGTDEIDITGMAVTSTVNLNNSLGNDNVNIEGSSSTNATVNLNNSGGMDNINIGSTTGATTATVNLNSSGGTDIVNINGATDTATVNLANSTGVGDFVELVGKGTGTINAVNSTGNDTLIGANSTDTITGGTGNDTVDLKGAGTINAGSGNDLGIYTLWDHYKVVGTGSSATLQSLNGDVDYYYGQGGINTLDIVLTAAQWALPAVQTDLANYSKFLATNPGVNQTYTFHFGASTGALTVAGWQNLDVILPPVIAVPGAQTLGVGKVASISGVSLSEAGTTTGSETFTATLTDTHGLLSATGTGGTVSGSGTTSLSITGSLSQVNTDLTSLSDTDATTGSETITLHATDSFGNAAAQKTIAVTVAAVPQISSFTESKGGTGNKTLTYTVTASDSVGITSVQIEDTSASPNINLGTATLSSGTSTNGTWTGTFTNPPNGTDHVANNDTLTATVTDADGNTATATVSAAAPAGIAGSSINLALDDPSGVGALTTVTISGVPSDWSLNAGTNNGDGSWIEQGTDLASLAVTTPATFAGAVVLNVSESWTNADGSMGSAFVTDNVEAYTPGSPIFALSGNDTLTGAGGNDEFVFSQPIGNDVIYSFNVASDKIDLIGFNNVASFSDIQANLTDDANGNAAITIGNGETITLNGVDAASLTASDFVFNQTPVTNNASSMVISDGAILPLSGEVNNTGTIALNSTGDETDLELIQNGITLQGGGALTLSDNSANVIFGTDPSVVLTNVDNTISGAGQLGEGQMTLVNEGTIDATGTNALVVDTGSNVIDNSGTLEATGVGGLIVNSAVANSGSLLADGGNLTFNGAVTGNGSATISGAASLEFAGTSAENVNFAAGSTGTLKLDDSAAFTGSVSGLTTTTYIDLADLSWAQGQMVASFSGDASGGKLTVSDGTQSDTINLSGDYTQSGWTLSQDSKGNTLVVDPPLASAPNRAGDTSTMLLAQYAAAGFQSGVGGGPGGFTTTPTPEAVLSEPPSLTKPT